jgi:hypothetical protein
MPVSTTIKVVGVKDTINALRKIDPQLQKDFKHRQHKSPSQQLALAKRSIHKCHCQAWHTTGLATVANYSRLQSAKRSKVYA